MKLKPLNASISVVLRHTFAHPQIPPEHVPPQTAPDFMRNSPLATREVRAPVADDDGDGGKLLPRFPQWLMDGTRPSRLSWRLKDMILPPVYWHGMLKGPEWMVKPHRIGA